MKNLEENIIQDTKDPSEKLKREGLEMSAEQAGQITAELSKLDDAIAHDKPILIEDLEDLSKVAKGTKIDVGGEIMTVEEAEKIPDLKMNVEIWQEVKNGNFGNTRELTKITPEISGYLPKNDDISLDRLTSAKGLVLPQSIDGSIGLNGLIYIEGLVLPKNVRHSLELDNLIFAKGLILPEHVGAYLSLGRLTSAEGVIFPQYVGGNLWLDSLISAKGLILPESIGRDLYLRSLTSFEGLALPQNIGGDIYLGDLDLTEKEKLKEKYPQYKDKIK